MGVLEFLKKKECEYILCAAIWFDDGKEYPHQPLNINSGLVLCGFRHSCIFSQLGGLVGERKALGIHEKEQGFLTSKNRFVDRMVAMELAYTAKQVPNEVWSTCKELYSEDLY
jgi:hypothetical protein